MPATRKTRNARCVLTDRNLIRHLNADRDCVATMMVDYYGLPQSREGAWPGRARASASAFTQKARIVQDCLSADTRRAMRADFDSRRFIPYLMMHEFEALLFSDCDRFGSAIGRADLIPRLQQIRDSFESPEQIDESPNQVPSKRIEALYPGCQKPFLGTLAALEIGLPKIRAECPHFSSWVSHLEELPATS